MSSLVIIALNIDVTHIIVPQASSVCYGTCHIYILLLLSSSFRVCIGFVLWRVGFDTWSYSVLGSGGVGAYRVYYYCTSCADSIYSEID